MIVGPERVHLLQLCGTGMQTKQLKHLMHSVVLPLVVLLCMEHRTELLMPAVRVLSHGTRQQSALGQHASPAMPQVLHSCCASQ